MKALLLVLIVLSVSACSQKWIIKEGTCIPFDNKDDKVDYVCDNEVYSACQYVSGHGVSLCKEK